VTPSSSSRATRRSSRPRRRRRTARRCFGQYPDRRHVDFNAYWDGPVFARDDGDVAGGAPISVDDLVICEECVRAAATVLELTDEDTRRHVLQMEREVEELRERLARRDDYIAKLEDAPRRAASSRTNCSCRGAVPDGAPGGRGAGAGRLHLSFTTDTTGATMQGGLLVTLTAGSWWCTSDRPDGTVAARPTMQISLPSAA
jgi:hypothetical protein